MKKASLVLRCHEMAARYPAGSDKYMSWLEAAHLAFMERKTGRPKGVVNMADHIAVLFMYHTRQTTGETCARKLAKMAIDAGMVPVRGAAIASVVDRLARKYSKNETGWVFIPVEK
jgi:hypothetical protein